MTWTVAIDVGGTFTDAVADDGLGRRVTVKVPTVAHDPSQGAPRLAGRAGRRRRRARPR